MNHTERRIELIKMLINEGAKSSKVKMKIKIPTDAKEQRKLLRSLMNLRQASEASEEFYNLQNDYLIEENKRRRIIRFRNFLPIKDDCIYLIKGDISLIDTEIVVNAYNHGPLGCFKPNHNCLENTIHTYAGVQVREECREILEERGKDFEEGELFLTSSNVLPALYIIHVKSIKVGKEITKQDEEKLAQIYISCLNETKKRGFYSIAFPPISTGASNFPHEKAAEIAVNTVREWLKENDYPLCVVFVMLRSLDFNLYDNLLDPEGAKIRREVEEELHLKAVEASKPKNKKED